MEAPRPSCPKCSQTQVIKKGVIALFPNPKGQVRVLNLGIFDYPLSCRAPHERGHAESQVMPSPGGERIGGAVFMRYASA
jgi:hypothetical protein